MSETSNIYCTRLGIPVPRVEDVLAQKGARLLHVMVVALLEGGGPMTVEEIAERLKSAGAESGTGDMARSLRRAWGGREPIHKDPEGRYALDLNCESMRMVLSLTGLMVPAPAPPEPPPPDVRPPADDVALTAEELEAALNEAASSGLSYFRIVAAVLDAEDRPMSMRELNQRLAELTGLQKAVDEGVVRGLQSALIRCEPDGRFVIDRTAADLHAIRRAVRKVAYVILRRRAMAEHHAKVGAAWKARHAAEEAAREAKAQTLRRAVLRVLPSPADPRAVAVLDVERHSIRTFIGGKVAEVACVLAEYDVLVGLGVRDDLHGLHLDEGRWTIVDLRPPRKSTTINKSGRKLQITPEMLITATVGISRPLADPDKIRGYLEGGEEGKLDRRLQSDVKALYAFYQYGRIQNFVRLRWGFLDDILGVEWALPGEPSLYATLERARDQGKPIDLVMRSAPGWSDPWSRAWRVRVVRYEVWALTVDDGRSEVPVDRREIQAVRIAEAPAEGAFTSPEPAADDASVEDE